MNGKSCQLPNTYLHMYIVITYIMLDIVVCQILTRHNFSTKLLYKPKQVFVIEYLRKYQRS